MNITENNKIIAEFMNCENPQAWKDDLYSSDWNWLMEVVEKIETTLWDFSKDKRYLINKDKFKRTVGTGNFYISYDESENFKGWTCTIEVSVFPSIRIKDFEDRFNTKIEAYYQAVMQFITWYNEQQK